MTGASTSNLSVGRRLDDLDAAIEAGEWDAVAQMAAVINDSPMYRKFTRMVVAPAGRLGIVVDTTLEGAVVHSIKPDSPLQALLSVGDIIAAVDDVDTKGMDAASITSLMAAKANPERTLTVLSNDPLAGMEPNDIQVPLAASSNVNVVPESKNKDPRQRRVRRARRGRHGRRRRGRPVPAPAGSSVVGRPARRGGTARLGRRRGGRRARASRGLGDVGRPCCQAVRGGTEAARVSPRELHERDAAPERRQGARQARAIV
jgi:hypothetical protein